MYILHKYIKLLTIFSIILEEKPISTTLTVEETEELK